MPFESTDTSVERLQNLEERGLEAASTSALKGTMIPIPTRAGKSALKRRERRAPAASNCIVTVERPGARFFIEGPCPLFNGHDGGGGFCQSHRDIHKTPMKKTLFLAIGLVALLAQGASAQTVTNLINSWENSVEGWGPDGTIWTSGGFSTTTGVTEGSYSWILNASASPGYGFALGGTASTAITYDLAYATEVQIDVYTPPGSFGYMQWDLDLNGGGLGYASTDGYTYNQSPTIGSESMLTFTIPPSEQATLQANLTTPTSLNFQIGGSGTGTMYLDDLTIVDPVSAPEPSVLALVGVGAAGLLAVQKRRHRAV
jgi:hypothetical protein